MRFVFRDKVFKVGFAVQVARNVCDLEPALLKIVQGFLKQTVVVGLEPDFAVVAEKDTVFLQLTWVGKPLFVVGAGWPWIAEINKNPVNGVARPLREKFVQYRARTAGYYPVPDDAAQRLQRSAAVPRRACRS